MESTTMQILFQPSYKAVFFLKCGKYFLGEQYVTMIGFFFNTVHFVYDIQSHTTHFVVVHGGTVLTYDSYLLTCRISIFLFKIDLLYCLANVQYTPKIDHKNKLIVTVN